MTITVGIDSVEIPRVAKSILRPRFLDRVYSLREQKHLAGQSRPAQTAAAHFAAKEAFSKAVGTGLRGFALPEVSVEYDPLGKPFLALSGAALALSAGMRFDVSITHTRDTATAVVVAYKEE